MKKWKRSNVSRIVTWLWLAVGAAVLINAAACGGLTCTSPVKDTAERVAALDFSQRANGTLMRCADARFVYSLKVRG